VRGIITPPYQSVPSGVALTAGRRIARRLKNAGKVSTRDVLDRYVEALGGRLSLMADFGDELPRVG
jgi:hypothetical protein